MGILAYSMRLTILLQQQNNIEFRQMAIAEKISNLTGQIADIDEFNNDLDANSATVKRLESEKKRLNDLEKKLTLQKQNLDTRYQQITSEIQSLRQALPGSIQQSGLFNYGMMGGR